MGVKVGERNDKPGWWVFVNYHGQRTKKCFGTDKRAAKAFAEKLAARLKWAEQSGEPIALSRPEQTMPTVEAYLREWLITYAEVHCKPTTAAGYRLWLEKYIFPSLGDRRLHEVTRADIKRLIATLYNLGRKKHTIHNILTPLKEAYHHAMDEGLVASNPVARTGRLTRSKEDRRAHIAPLTAEEVRTLLQAAQEKVPSVYVLLLCAVRTGMRQGELIGLQWSDVDFRGGFIEVRRAVAMRRLSSTKSHKIRRVDMTPQLTYALKRLKEAQELEAGMTGHATPEWVFVTPSKTRWDDSNLRMVFYRLLERAGMRRVRFHDLRHTYASLMAEAGAPPKYVQEQLGHSSIQITMDIYSHLFPSGNREWVKRLDDELVKIESAPQLHPAEVDMAARAA
jgi:integrase